MRFFICRCRQHVRVADFHCRVSAIPLVWGRANFSRLELSNHTLLVAWSYADTCNFPEKGLCRVNPVS